jgi:energy-coupling factor transporter transmembrane protein EcfT
MTGTEIAFFAAIATIIPVFLVAYVLGVNKMTQALGQRYFKSFGEYSRRVDEAIKSREGIAKNVVRALAAYFAAIVYQLSLLSLFIAAVALPSSQPPAHR